jgi:diguanylate cyclase (GGDEF)-like protein
MVTAKPLEQLEVAVAAAVDEPSRVHALNALATELARTGHAKRAIVLATEARTIAETIPGRGLVAMSQHTLARSHFYLAEFVAALELLLEAARGYQAQGEIANAATALAGVGLCQHRLGAQEDAVSSLLNALESARELKLETLEINIYNSLASALLAAGRNDEADRYLATGVDLAHRRDDRSLLTKLVHNQALVAKRNGDGASDRSTALTAYEAALALAERALALARELGNRYDEAHALGQAGTMLRLLGRVDEADHALKGALALGRALDETRVQAEAYLELGRLHLGIASRLPRRYLLRAIVLAQKSDAKALLAQAYLDLSAQHEGEGNLAAALAAHKRYHAVREDEFMNTRRHAARAAQLWIHFRQASRQAKQYREQAKLLAEDKVALTRRAEALAVALQQDPLTGLLNRRGLDAQVGDVVMASEESGVPLTVALLDVDRFKNINDSFSHMVGDAVLKRIAALIQAHCRANDLPVRYGGDEFLIVLAGADRQRSAAVFHRLKEAVDAYRWTNEARELAVSVSIGVATHMIGTSIAATIADADRALYRAKIGGRNRVVIAP